MRQSRVHLVVPGLALLAAGLLGLGAVALADPAVARGLVLLMGSQLLIGQEASIPVALASEVPPLLTWTYATAQDAVVLLLGFPLVELLRARLERTRLGASFFEAAERRAATSNPKGQWRTGLLLAGTTWIPFLPSGALVAAGAGTLLGVRHRVLLPLLIVARSLSAAAFVLAYGPLIDAAARVDPRLPLGVAGGLVVVFAVANWWTSRRRDARIPD